MLVTLVLSSALIIKFDLDGGDSNEFDETQKAVGYITLIVLSINVGGFALTCG